MTAVVNAAPPTDLALLTDAQLLALLVAAEADNQPLAGQVAVACTVLERKRRRRPHYGLTLRTIMLKPFQYSTFNTDHWRRHVDRLVVYLPLATLAIAECLRSPVEGATHYHRADLDPWPGWAQPESSTFLGQLGAHRFYREH